jgi:hypothetical protein
MTERKRPSRRRTMAEAGAPATSTPATVAASVPAARPGPSAPPSSPTPSTAPRAPQKTEQRPGGVKYTAVLDDDTTDAFETLTRVARRRLGRHVDKIEVMRALLLLAADDTSVRDQMIENLRTPAS